MLGTELVVTAGDTAPPDLDEVARGGPHGGEDVVTPIAFKLPPVGAARLRPQRWSKATIGASLGAAALAVFAWFAFTAKSVALDFDPEPDAIQLAEHRVQAAIRRSLAAAARVASRRRELPGYYPLDTQIEVGKASDQTIELKLLKLPGLVTLTTEPEARRACCSTACRSEKRRSPTRRSRRGCTASSSRPTVIFRRRSSSRFAARASASRSSQS